MFQFVKNRFGNIQITNPNLRESVYKTLLSGNYINSLLQSYMINTEEYTNHILAASNSFADYLYNNYPKVKPTAITLPIHNVDVEIGKTYKLAPSLLPTNTSNNKIIYKSSNESIATVDEFGVIFINTPGKVIITCMSDENNELIDYCIVNTPILVTNIKLNINNVILNKNQTLQLEPVIVPSNITNKILKFESSNKNIIDINENGLMKAINNGTALITCSSTDGSLINSKCEVTVTDGIINVFKNDVISENTNVASQDITINHNIIPNTNDNNPILGYILISIMFLSLNVCVFFKPHNIS